MRAWPLLLLAACTEPVVTGVASSNVHPAVRSASTFVANVALGDRPGEYRRWTIEIGEVREGTDCQAAGAPIIAIELYTIFDSAPRGLIPLSPDPPPRIFPAAFVTVIDAIDVDGYVMITSASTTGLKGTLTGTATIEGGALALDVAFDAPTCAL